MRLAVPNTMFSAVALGSLSASSLLFLPNSDACSMGHGVGASADYWIMLHGGQSTEVLYKAVDVETTTPGVSRFNMSLDIRHGPSEGVGTIVNNTIDIFFNNTQTHCRGLIDQECNNIIWEEDANCVTDKWCRSYTEDCASPPPPYGVGFSFYSSLSSNMVLQQAPAQAAVYGITTPGTRLAVNVTVMDNETNVLYTVPAQLNTVQQASGPEFVGMGDVPIYPTWKALLKPMPVGGNYTIVAHCEGCTQTGEYSTVNISNVTFGDVWHCSGQSNMWLPVENTFSRNLTLANITKLGKYHNIRAMFGGSASGPSNPWRSALQAATNAPPPNRGDPDPSPYLFQLGATCWYFAQALTDMFTNAGLTPPPIGLTDNAIGGQRIEEFMVNDSTLYACANRTGENSPEWNGRLYGQQVLPFVDMTAKGWVWYQGENNMGGTKGSALANVGYACETEALIAGWRAQWSKIPGTTDPNAPFGIVTLASSGSEGGPDMGAMRIAQTAGYGVLPAPSGTMANTFFAQAYDLDDEWGPYAGNCVTTWACCTWNSGVAGHGVYNETACKLGTNNNPSICNNACAAAMDTQSKMGGIHPRSKKPVGDRLGRAAFNTVYKGKESYTGPTLAGCQVSSDNKLVIDFDTTLLRGDELVLQPYTTGSGGSYLDVQVNASQFCAEPQLVNFSNSSQGIYCPTWAGGSSVTNASAGLDQDWIRLNISATAGSTTSITVDLTPLNGTGVNGTTPTPSAVRYAWGIISCCDPNEPGIYETHGCIANCPIMSSASLPANPFIAQIVDGKCKCLPPMTC